MFTLSRKFLLAVFLPLLLGCVAPASQAGNRALLIGINKYEDARIPSLKGTGNDLQAMHTLLVQRLHFKETDILQLENEQATHDGILNAIDDWLVKGSAPGDHVVLYYSGHGEQTGETSGDEDDNLDEALVAHDAVLETRQNYVLDDDINQKIQALKGREVLAVIDSCHSGTVTRGLSTLSYADAKTPGQADHHPLSPGGRGVGERGAQQDSSALDNGGISRGDQNKAHQTEGNFLNPAAQLTAFFAVSPTQLALENKLDREHPHGVFSGAFVEGANGKADSNGDKQVSYAELLEYVRASSQAYCQANAVKCPQGLTPDLEADKSKLARNFLDFGLPASAAPALPPAQTVEAILPHGNAAGLSLSIERGDHNLAPGENLKLGDPVHYRFRSGRAGKLVIFDLDATGKLTQLFPAATRPAYVPVACRQSMSLTERVPAGQSLRIPDACMGVSLTAQEPVGQGKVVAVLIEDESIDTRDLIATPQNPGPAGARFVQIPQGEQWMTALRTRLDQVFHVADGTNRAVSWSVLAVDYAITP